MRLGDLGEREVIRQLVTPLLRKYSRGYVEDDCAVLPLDGNRSLLLTTDISSPTTFLSMLEVGTFFDLGHYFATMSLSDIAAMGGRPLALVAGCSCEPEFSTDNFEELIKGLAMACEEQGAHYVGGDTKEGDSLSVVTSALGVVATDKTLTRRGAIVGDLVCLSGSIGKTLRSYIDAARRKDVKPNLNVLRPKARVDFALSLAKQGIATSCIDMSDGPLAAAQTLSEINQVLINLDLKSIELAKPPAKEINPELWKSLILNVGGDYELMFTVHPTEATKAIQLGGIVCGSIEATNEKGEVRLSIVDGMTDLKPWEHFKSTNQIINVIKSML